MNMRKESTNLISNDNPYSNLLSGSCSIYIPAPTTYFCGAKWSQFWYHNLWIRLIITYLIIGLSCWSILMIFISLIANIICFNDLLLAIIAVRRLAGAFFVILILVGITKGLLGIHTYNFNHPISSEVIALIMRFKLIDDPENQPKFVKFLFGFWFLTSVSIYLTIIPLLNKNIWPLRAEEGPPSFLLISDFAATVIKIYHYQLFWVICYGVTRIIENRMEEIVTETEDISKTLEPEDSLEVEEIAGCDKKNSDDNLMSMKKICVQIKDLVTTIDEKIRLAIFLGVLETACGVVIPFIVYINFLHMYSDSKERVFIHALHIPWIFVRFFFFGCGFYWAIKIPNTYNKFVTRYKIAVYKILSVESCRLFEDKFQFTKRELLDEDPSFTIGGFVNMKIFALAILSCCQLLYGFDAIKTISETIVRKNVTELDDFYLPLCYDESATSVFNETSAL